MTIEKSTVDRLVVALDVPTAEEAIALAERLKGRVGMLKIGLELFCAEGPAFIREVQATPRSSSTSSCTTSPPPSTGPWRRCCPLTPP